MKGMVRVPGAGRIVSILLELNPVHVRLISMFLKGVSVNLNQIQAKAPNLAAKIYKTMVDFTQMQGLPSCVLKHQMLLRTKVFVRAFSTFTVLDRQHHALAPDHFHHRHPRQNTPYPLTRYFQSPSPPSPSIANLIFASINHLDFKRREAQVYTHHVTSQVTQSANLRAGASIQSLI